MTYLRALATKGHTVVISSHTISEVETHCDHIAIVRDGHIVEDSTINRLQAQAPRQIVVTLRADQPIESVRWPSYVSICHLLASFLLNFLAQFQDWAKLISRWLSVMEYYRPAIIIQTGVFPWFDILALITISVLMWIASGLVFRNRSICTV